MRIKCVVACHNSMGEPDFLPVKVNCSPEQYDNGEHYDKAIDEASKINFARIFVVFDENDGPDWLFERFDWGGAVTVDA